MSLRFQEQNGKNTVFVDPTNPQSALVVSSTTSKKPVGKNRVRNVHTRISQAHWYNADDCDECSKLMTDERGVVELHGTTIAERKLVWEALKVNVDTLINQGVLDALRPELTLSTLKSAEELRPSTP